MILKILIISLGLTVISVSGYENFSTESVHTKSARRLDINRIQRRKFMRKISNNIIKHMDRSIDPCTDFYGYVCGNWEQHNPIPDHLLANDVAKALEAKMKKSFLKLLRKTTEMESAKYLDDCGINKLKNFFKSCMDVQTLSREGVQPYFKMIETLAEWPLFVDDWNEDQFDWLNVTAQMQLLNFNNILMTIYNAADPDNSERYITFLTEPTLPSSVSNEPETTVIAYKRYIAEVFRLLEIQIENPNQFAQDIFDFGIALKKIKENLNTLDNYADKYNRITIAELIKQSPNIDWQQYFSIIEGETISLDKYIVVEDINYFRKLSAFILNSNPRKIANYILWKFTENSVNYLDNRFDKLQNEVAWEIFGIKLPEREHTCLKLLTTNMETPLAALYTQKYFKQRTKLEILDMAHQLQNIYEEFIMNKDWLDDETQKAIIKKLYAIRFNIGISDHACSNDDYKNVEINPEKFYSNILELYRYNFAKEQKLLSKKNDPNDWNVQVLSVDAFFQQTAVTATFPVAYLQPPYYHNKYPKYLTYSALGSTIGHEITHAFDRKGRIFNEKGELRHWWSNTSIANFENLAQCFLEQYNNYTYYNEPVNGKITQNENIADNGGIQSAYYAYKRWEQNNDKETVLPKLHLSNDKIFFINYARTYCSATDTDIVDYEPDEDKHSPNKYRVIGTLSNFDKFAETFNCPRGSPMNPEKKCQIW